MAVRIETIDRIQVAGIRHVGPCSEVGQCFGGLCQWASAVGVPTGGVPTLSRDDPERVPADRLRSAAGVELRTREATARHRTMRCLGRASCGPAARRPVRGHFPGVRPAVRRVTACERRVSRRRAGRRTGPSVSGCESQGM